MKQDLTTYSDQELDLWVQNDEGFYNEFMRQAERATYRDPDTCFNELIDYLSESLMFNQAQEDELRATFDEQVDENNEDDNQD